MGILASLLSGAGHGTASGNMVDGVIAGADGQFYCQKGKIRLPGRRHLRIVRMAPTHCGEFPALPLRTHRGHVSLPQP